MKRDDILSGIKAYMSQINLQHGTITVKNRKLQGKKTRVKTDMLRSDVPQCFTIKQSCYIDTGDWLMIRTTTLCIVTQLMKFEVIGSWKVNWRKCEY